METPRPARTKATTGEVIDASLITGLNAPMAVALLGNTLFVANLNGFTVGEYDQDTGKAINANFITGLSEPYGIAVQGSYDASGEIKTAGRPIPNLRKRHSDLIDRRVYFLRYSYRASQEWP